MFHMTDLPFGRGGSALQNFIVSGISEKKIIAFRCDDGIDCRAIYLQCLLSLYGNAEEIYIRATQCIETMIRDICNGDIIPQA